MEISAARAREDTSDLFCFFGAGLFRGDVVCADPAGVNARRHDHLFGIDTADAEVVEAATNEEVMD